MSRRIGILVVAALVVVAVVATPVNAHSTAGVTKIYVDGQLVKNTTDDHVTYTQALSPGCHNVRVVRSVSGSVSAVLKQHLCVFTQTSQLTVTVDHDSISISTTCASTSTSCTSTSTSSSSTSTSTSSSSTSTTVTGA